jgi:Na+/proline symporter
MKSVLSMAIFAYTIYGVSITPALIAALAWKRATKIGGLVSIISGTFVTIFLRIMAEILPPEMVSDGDPFGIPIIFPGLVVSIGSLVIVSLLTKKPTPEEIEKFFPTKETTQSDNP